MQSGGCLAYLHSVSIPIAFGSFHLVQGMPFQSSIQALQQSLLILHLAVLFTLVALHCIVHAYSQAQIFLLRWFFVSVLHILREPLKCLLYSSHQTYFNFHPTQEYNRINNSMHNPMLHLHIYEKNDSVNKVKTKNTFILDQVTKSYRIF